MGAMEKDLQAGTCGKEGAGGNATGEVVRLLLSKDWSETPFGPVEGWPSGLVNATNIALASPNPAVIFWGPELRLLYNDASVPLLGPAGHPQALGERAEIIWPTISDAIQSLRDRRTTGVLGAPERLRLDVMSGGRRTESSILLTYSAIVDDQGQIGGFFCPVVEATYRVPEAPHPDAPVRGCLLLLAALRASEEKLARLFESMPDGIAVLDVVCDSAGAPVDYIFLDINPAYESIVGVKKADILGKRASALFGYAPFAAEIGGVALSGQPRQCEAYVAPLHLYLQMSAFSTERGKVTVVFADHTDRRQAEDELRDQRAHFAARSRLVEELREADRRKNEFIAMLSHELRNPLAPIKNSLFVLENGEPASVDAQAATHIIERQVNQLARLVDDLLDVTRIAQGKIQLRRERVDLNEVVRRAVEDNQSIFVKGGVHLSAELADAPVFVDGDAARLGQVVGNLLQNAAKFTPSGGEATAKVSVDKVTSSAIIRIVDTGLGIDRQSIGRLFQPFTQVGTSTDRSKGGLGLGLVLVKGLVELHGGEVSADSQGLLHGSEFIVRLPLDASRPARFASDRASGAPSRLRVLLIEDNADAAESFRAVLRIFKHEVEVVNNGPDGIERARVYKPDVVLCDIGLPGMSGYEIVAAFRADEALRPTFMIALTGYAQPEDRERALSAGFDRHLAKPPEVSKLLQILADPCVMERRQPPG